MSEENKRAVGKQQEERAARYLEEKGCEILEMNFRCRLGEIDIIAKDGDCLVFVEVKFRQSLTSGDPLSSVDIKKQRTISRVALYYLLQKGLGQDAKCRFDVIGITPDELTHIEQAFEFRK